MVIATKSEGIPYLNKKIVVDKGVKTVKISSVPDYVDTEYQGKSTGKKLECRCKTQVLDPTEVRWTMNRPTQNYMIEKYGSDTSNWVGKEVSLKVASIGSTSPSVYPLECSLERVIA